MTFQNHDLVEHDFQEILYLEKPAYLPSGEVAPGLHNIWICLNNPTQLNSYTTAAVKEIILGFRKASNDRACVAVVFTGVGDRAFCTGGNTKEYAEYYSGQPEEYRQYMRLFNDMVSGILHCDKPVICRVNGMRIGGGQEIGMACDFSIAHDMARFGQAGPRHGSAPVGGSTDFLPLFVGVEHAMFSCTVCEPWSAHKALRLGLLSAVVPALKVDGEFVPNPLVYTDNSMDNYGHTRHGEPKEGEDKSAAKAVLKSGEMDLSLLDAEIDKYCTKLMMTFPGCLSFTVESIRKHKLEHWNRNKEASRSWLGLNMMTEAASGFRSFNAGTRADRDADFPMLRQRLAEGARWSEELILEVGPPGLRGEEA